MLDNAMPGQCKTVQDKYIRLMFDMFEYIRRNQVRELAALLEECPEELKSRLHEDHLFLPMEWAIDRGYPDIVNVLLAAGINPETKNWKGCTPLIMAAQRNEWNIVDQLLQAGVNTASKSGENLTALHFAVKEKKQRIAQKLLSRGAPVHCVDNDNRTPLSMAINDRDTGMIKLLLGYATPLRCNYVGDRYGSDLVNALLERPLRYPGVRCGYLMRAVFTSTPDIALQLIKAGFDPDGASVTPTVKTAPLVNMLGTFRLFMDEPNSKSYQDWEERIWQYTELLLNSGADPNLPSISGWTPLGAAVLTGRVEIISLLAENGARRVGLDGPLFQDHVLSSCYSIAPRAEVMRRVSSLDPVMPLQVNCRLRIRKILLNCRKQGESLFSNVPQLPLPRPMQKYLCNIGGAGI